MDKKFDEVIFKHIYCECNRAVELLTKLVVRTENLMYRMLYRAREISKIIFDDVIGRPTQNLSILRQPTTG